MFIVIRKLSRLVSTYLPRSSFLSEQRFEGRVEGLHPRDVAVEAEVRAELFGERADAPFERFALIGERQVRAVFAELLRDAPGERFLVGQTHDEAAFSLHQRGHALPFFPSCDRAARARLSP
jgi:hypothetical protein